MDDLSTWLPIDDVTERLGVKRSTVYSYVSRGLLRSRKVDGSRESLFDPASVERLVRRREQRGAERSNVESEITLVRDGQLFYRGASATQLALDRDFEEVAQFLWSGDSEVATRWEADPGAVDVAQQLFATLPVETSPLQRLWIICSLAGAVDPMRDETHPAAVKVTARRLLATLVEAMPEQSTDADDAPSRHHGLAGRLWSRLSPREPTDGVVRALNGCMVVLADHDLAPSTRTVRTAASEGADPYGAVSTGLHCGRGPVKGGSSLAIELYLQGAGAADNAEAAIAMQVRRGGSVPGFGHPLYPDGDCRARTILDLLAHEMGGSERMRTVATVLDVQKSRGLSPPNAGFALAALSFVAEMVPGSGEAIFGIARAAGWVAHAIEEYQSPRRTPRGASVYVGPAPRAADAGGS